MEADYKSKWEKCLSIITDNIGEKRANTWFGVAKPVGYEDKKLTLRIPSRFFYEKYEDEFYGILSSSLRKVFGQDVQLAYQIEIIEKDKDSRVTIEGTKQSPIIKNRFLKSMQSSGPLGTEEENRPDFDPQLNEAYTFENYCLGESNKLPYAIAEHIANHPGTSDFNPFFLYGQVGVGKTHLIQAIGIRVKERNPRSRVCFVTLRQFQQLYQNAIISKKVPHFINWFQQMDVLLIDDLQELSHKEGTTEALFAIFNYLHQNNKSLIFTCDRPPMELDGLADRLIDRFKWGITEKLPAPDLALKKKILEFKASKNGLALSKPVIDLIAEQSTGSIRELEGIVMGILTRSIMLNCPITIDLAKQVMSHTIKPKEKKVINFEMIVETTAEFYKINPDIIFSKSRHRDVADVRQVIMYLSNKLTNLSSSVIGQKLNRAHTTVLHGITAIENRLSYSKELRESLEKIEDDLKS